MSVLGKLSKKSQKSRRVMTSIDHSNRDKELYFLEKGKITRVDKEYFG